MPSTPRNVVFVINSLTAGGAERALTDLLAHLQDDLRRAGIETYGWIVNATLAGSGTADPILARRAEREQAQLTRVAAVASRAWVVPWTAALGAAHSAAARSSS